MDYKPMHESNTRDVDPEEALELYIQEKERECSTETVYSHQSRLSHFVEWFNSQTEYDYLHELDGYDLKKYEGWRYDDSYSNVTIHTQQTTLRVFLKFCRNIEAVPDSLPEKVQLPSDGTGQRDNEIGYDRMMEILEYLDRYKYASQKHVTAHLLWYSMMRVGGLHSIDLEDLDLEKGYIEIEHRPDTGTRLKNQGDGERIISIRPETVSLLNDYLDTHRHDVEDNHGREPLLTTKNGRPGKKTIRNWCYAVTRPCIIRGECPHDRTQEECDAAANQCKAHGCPSSESTHAFRRGAISWMLGEGTERSVVGDRADVSPEVLEEHYNTLSEKEKADVRREKLPD